MNKHFQCQLFVGERTKYLVFKDWNRKSTSFNYFFIKSQHPSGVDVCVRMACLLQDKLHFLLPKSYSIPVNTSHLCTKLHIHTITNLHNHTNLQTDQVIQNYTLNKTTHPLNKTNREWKMIMSLFWSINTAKVNMNYFPSITNTPLAKGLSWEAFLPGCYFYITG